jgi:hypothetical protein
MDYEMNLEMQRRQANVRRLAHKLASNRSKKRVVRKLPQAYTIMSTGLRPAPVEMVRQSLNRYKVAGYAILMGMALGAFILEFDADTLESLRNSMEDIAGLSTRLLSRT